MSRDFNKKSIEGDKLLSDHPALGITVPEFYRLMERYPEVSSEALFHITNYVFDAGLAIGYGYGKRKRKKKVAQTTSN